MSHFFRISPLWLACFEGVYAVPDDRCVFARNGLCDEPVLCIRGTDCSDCGGCRPAPPAEMIHPDPTDVSSDLTDLKLGFVALLSNSSGLVKMFDHVLLDRAYVVDRVAAAPDHHSDSDAGNNASNNLLPEFFVNAATVVPSASSTLSRRLQEAAPEASVAASGQMLLTVQDPEAFVASNAAVLALRRALGTSASRLISYRQVFVSFGEPFANTVEANFEVAAPASYASTLVRLFQAASTATIAAGISQALAEEGASGLASGLLVESLNATVRSSGAFGFMGGCTNVSITSAGGTASAYEATPARWNAWHPKFCPEYSGWRCQCPQALGSAVPTISGPIVAARGLGHAGLGEACSYGVPAAPPRSSAVLLARRGGCRFAEKAAVALGAGYCGLLVANSQAGAPHPYRGFVELQDMTAGSSEADAEVELPAWLLSKAAGDEIHALLGGGAARAEAGAVRKAALGHGQADGSGIRDHRQE